MHRRALSCRKARMRSGMRLIHYCRVGSKAPRRHSDSSSPPMRCRSTRGSTPRSTRARPSLVTAQDLNLVLRGKPDFRLPLPPLRRDRGICTSDIRRGHNAMSRCSSPTRWSTNVLQRYRRTSPAPPARSSHMRARSGYSIPTANSSTSHRRAWWSSSSSVRIRMPRAQKPAVLRRRPVQKGAVGVAQRAG